MTAGAGSGNAPDNAPDPAPDFAHIDTWLFDLDNTLYPLGSGLAAIVSDRITSFVAELTGLPRKEALVLQKRYLAQYGLTLAGMLEHHGVDPATYHAMFHDLPLDSLAPDPVLRAGLERLPGRRLIFTNADDVHAARVLEHLELADLFEAVFHIGAADFAPKPSDAAFDRIMAAHAIAPARTAFFEDTAANLAPAAALGMTTVLVGPSAELAAPPFVNFRAVDLAAFLATVRL
jgi:putative hydrolase of the HAD superfamily